MHELENATKTLIGVDDVEYGTVFEANHLRYLFLVLGMDLVGVDDIDLDVGNDFAVLQKVNISDYFLTPSDLERIVLAMVLFQF